MELMIVLWSSVSFAHTRGVNIFDSWYCCLGVIDSKIENWQRGTELGCLHVFQKVKFFVADSLYNSVCKWSVLPNYTDMMHKLSCFKHHMYTVLLQQCHIP